MKKLLTIVTSLYVGGVASSTLLMFPFVEPLEALLFGLSWPYILIRVFIYSLTGV